MPEAPKPMPFVLPMLRQTLTFVPPWAPAQAITVQVIVSPGPDADFEGSPREGDVEELREAGWVAAGNSNVDVAVRIVL